MKQSQKHGFYINGFDHESVFSRKKITMVREKQGCGRWKNTRELTEREIDILKTNNCTAESWENIRVNEPFNPCLIKNSDFKGIVRIGKLEKGELKDDERVYECGIYNSTIISSDIGDYCSISNNRYISDIITGNYVILSDNDEIMTSEHANFGNCIARQGSSPSSVNKLKLVNERGGREVPVLSSMRGEDIFILVKYREKAALMEKLEKIVLDSFDSEPGYYSFIDNYTVIKGCGKIRDIISGRNAVILRTKLVEDITVCSTAANPAVISDSICIKHGILGEGALIAAGSRAESFFMAPWSEAKNNAQLYHTYLGSFAVLSGGEAVSSFIFPHHEQNYSNSFLIASMLMGQSSISAGAVIGSNNNGRINDCEMRAGRGFRPGLCSSVRHNSGFASYSFLAKSDFPYQLDIRLPFSLISNNTAENCLEIIPAYWWLYNMYALFRNFFKYRDINRQYSSMEGIETDFLAPDTVEEIISALLIIEERRKNAINIETEFRSINLELPPEGFEGSDRIVKILRFDKASRAYREMLIFYCGYNIFSFINAAEGNYSLLEKASYSRERETVWVNLCGKLIPERDLKQIFSEIESGKLCSLEDLHSRSDSFFLNYNLEKLSHAVSVAMTLFDEDCVSERFMDNLKKEYLDILLEVEKEIAKTRIKDYEDPIRKKVYSSHDEMIAVMGRFESDPLPGRFRKYFIDMIKQ